MLDQHLWTTLHVLQAAVPGMVERGYGRIVAVTATSAANPGPRAAAYATAKSAEEALVRTLAREVASAGVTANLIASGPWTTRRPAPSSPTRRRRPGRPPRSSPTRSRGSRRPRPRR